MSGALLDQASFEALQAILAHEVGHAVQSRRLRIQFFVPRVIFVTSLAYVALAAGLALCGQIHFAAISGGAALLGLLLSLIARLICGSGREADELAKEVSADLFAAQCLGSIQPVFQAMREFVRIENGGRVSTILQQRQRALKAWAGRPAL